MVSSTSSTEGGTDNKSYPKAGTRQATSFQTSNGSNPKSDWDQGYGYQFWRCRNNAYRGDGAFGQFCIVIPEKDAVIAITASSDNMQGILDQVWDILLPGMKDQSLTENRENYDALIERLANLSLESIKGGNESEIQNTVSSNTYVFAENIQEIKSMQFNFGAEQTTLLLENSEGEFTVPIGFQSFEKGKMKFKDVGQMATACSGAWVDNDHFRMNMYFQETPHCMTYDVKFSGDSITVNVQYNVTLGQKKLPVMVGRTTSAS